MIKKIISAAISATIAASVLPTVCLAKELKYDINGDGYENAKDALDILRKSANNETDLRYDCNGDGYVNAKDALFVLKYAAGIPAETPDTDAPDTDAPDTDTPDTDAPDTDAPDTDTPDTDAPDTDTPDTDAPDTVTSEDFEAEVVRLVNIEREKYGLNPLKSDNEKLNKAADIRAREIEEYLDHTRPNGDKFSTVLAECGIYLDYAGENIAAGFETPERVVNAWLNSSGHRANILNGNYTHIGVGYNKSWNHWVQIFVMDTGNGGEKPDDETPDDIAPEDFGKEVVRLVNIEREKYRLKPLKFDNDKLNRAADIRAQEIELLFSDERPNETKFDTVLIQCGVKYSFADEIMACGQATPSEVVDYWLNSALRTCIFDGSFSHAGVGYNENGNYWVLLFITGL